MPSHDRTRILVLDTAPLLTSTLSSLLAFSNRFVTTKDVLEEVRGKGQRERLAREWKTLESTTLEEGTGAQSEGPQWQGLQVRVPSVAGITKIKEFARKTGDIAVLSAVDIGVLALAYDIEVEANGTWRLRNDVGGKRIGKDPEKKRARQLRKQLDGGNWNLDQSSIPQLARGATLTSPEIPIGGVDESVAQTSLTTSDNNDRQSLPNTSENLDPSAEVQLQQTVGPAAHLFCEEPPPPDASHSDWVHIPGKLTSRPPDHDEEGSEVSSVASDSDPTWITPENLHLHQSKDLGFFPSLKSDSSTSATKNPSNDNEQSISLSGDIDPLGSRCHKSNSDLLSHDESTKAPIMKAGLLTGDFAMQNVALQIGLNVLGVGGKRIRDVKCWVLRCYACFKLCKDPMRKFCPTCGGTTLTRVSITYTPSSPTGYILHLKPNFQYHHRGTVYSIPSAKPGSASFEKGASRRKGVNGALLVLREDQKEFQRGLSSLKVQKQKEERNLIKANKDRMDKSGVFTPFNSNGWNDPDWEAPMLLGEKGRKGAGRHQSQRGVRYGKDGLPVIGLGKNPNEARRRV